MALTRYQAIELLRRHAVAHGFDHEYLPDASDAAKWMPHDWVIAAVMEASSAVDTINVECRDQRFFPVFDSGQVRRPEVLPLAERLHAEHPKWSAEKCLEEAKLRITNKVIESRGLDDSEFERVREFDRVKRKALAWIYETASRAQCDSRRADVKSLIVKVIGGSGGNVKLIMLEDDPEKLAEFEKLLDELIAKGKPCKDDPS